jgi:hypothetical protein
MSQGYHVLRRWIFLTDHETQDMSISRMGGGGEDNYGLTTQASI